MSVAVKKTLADLESQVIQGIRRIKSEWINVGLALGEIRDNRMYSPLTFEAYLASKPEWEITRRHADRIIKSARTADAINQTKMSDWLPDVPNEAVSRALQILPEERQAEVYAVACHKVGEDKVPTAKDVQEAFDEVADGNELNPAETSGNSPPDHEDDVAEADDEKEPAWQHDVAIGCWREDSELFADALKDFKPVPNPLGTKYRIRKLDSEQLSDLLASVALIISKLSGDLDLRVKPGAA